MRNRMKIQKRDRIMAYNYLVTKNPTLIPGNPIVMVGGTVPGWKKKKGDLHFDHHKPGGHDIQLTEIPSNTRVNDQAVFVTTQLDADACAAAAWLQLLTMGLEFGVLQKSKVALMAIAYDCDHLGLPLGSDWDGYRDFAKRAVAALKQRGNALALKMGFQLARRETWSESHRFMYNSEAFRGGTEALVSACLGHSEFPGVGGEADEYFQTMENLRPKVYAACSLYKGCAIFDQRGFEDYIDPRLLVDWARKNATREITLTVRSGSNLPNTVPDWPSFSYTLGSVPLHSNGSPRFSDRGIWARLQLLEVSIREEKKVGMPETAWGGRNEVGGSSWRDPAIASPKEIIDIVLGLD